MIRLAAFLGVLAMTACSAVGSTREAARPRATEPKAPVTRSVEPTPPRPEPEPEKPAPPLGSDGRPRPASLSIASIGVHDLRVVPYRGTPDDAPGTRIQNGGVAASPHGPGGGVGPGGIGNYLITAHRTSSTRAFEFLPAVRPGDRVRVVAAGREYVYEIVRTRWTSFRSARSLARQSAPVPGHPQRKATRAMITLSTCATLEDHARGNYWADEFDNPEHRIDKIGVLVATRPA